MKRRKSGITRAVREGEDIKFASPSRKSLEEIHFSQQTSIHDMTIVSRYSRLSKRTNARKSHSIAEPFIIL